MTQPYDEGPVAPAATEEVAPEEIPAEDTYGTEAADAEVLDAEVLDAEAPEVDAPDQGGPSADDAGFGDPRVDDAVARLQDLTERSVGEHVEVFDDIHQRLREVLEEAAVEPAEEPRG